MCYTASIFSPRVFFNTIKCSSYLKLDIKTTGDFMFDSKLVLNHVPIFSELDDSLLLKIEEAGIIRAYKKDSIIMDQMYEGTGLYIITSGTVKVTENNDQGGEIILDILGEFDYFGEM